MASHRYRAYECLIDEEWKVLGVAYERNGAIFLFIPPRGAQRLAVANLELLSQEHLPDDDCRWGSLKSARVKTIDPSAFLFEAKGLAAPVTTHGAMLSWPRRVIEILSLARTKSPNRTANNKRETGEGCLDSSPVMIVETPQEIDAPAGEVKAEKARVTFTFGDLVPVIAIISALAVILVPVFVRGRENARKSTCASYLKQISYAMVLYQQDYNERYPLNEYSSGTGTNRRLWQDLLYTYVRNQQPFQCPSAPGPALITPTGIPSSYMLNNVYRGASEIQIFDSSGQGPSSTADVEDAVNTVFIADGDNSKPGSFQITDILFASSSSLHRITSVQGDLVGLHYSTVNCAFLDGHVKALKTEELMKQGQNAAGTTRYRYFSAEKD